MTNLHYPILAAVTFCGALLTSAHSLQAEDPETDWTEFETLFNGNDLSGWSIVVDEGATAKGEDIFRVEDGAIHAYSKDEAGSEQPFAGLYTNESYADYHLALEYRWGEKKFSPREGAVRDAGIIFHIVGDPKIWPTGIECQIQEGDTGDIWIVGQTRASSPVHPIAHNFDARGDLDTRGAGKGPQRFSRGYCWEREGWNLVEVIVEDNNAVFKVNGHIVNEVVHMRHREDASHDWGWQELTEGRIMLQAEGAEVSYRNIRLKSLARD